MNALMRFYLEFSAAWIRGVRQHVPINGSINCCHAENMRDQGTSLLPKQTKLVFDESAKFTISRE